MDNKLNSHNLSKKEIDDAKELLQGSLESNKAIFLNELRASLSGSTIDQYDGIIQSWINYIIDATEIYDFSQIKVSECRNTFYRESHLMYDGNYSAVTVNNKLGKFLKFLMEEGWENDKVFQAFGI